MSRRRQCDKRIFVIVGNISEGAELRMESKQTFRQKIKAQKAEIQAGVNELKRRGSSLCGFVQDRVEHGGKVPVAGSNLGILYFVTINNRG
jgi:hypothetical protein